MNIRTFMSGVIALLPIVATLTLVAWVGGFIYSYFGPGSAIGRVLTSLGLGLVGSPLVAYLVGLVIIATLIYGLGVVVESSLQPRLYGQLDAMMQRIPLVGMVYDLSKRFVGMLDRKDAKDVEEHESGLVLHRRPGQRRRSRAAAEAGHHHGRGRALSRRAGAVRSDPVRRNVGLRAGEMGGAGRDAGRRPDEHLRVDGRGVAEGDPQYRRCSGRVAATALNEGEWIMAGTVDFAPGGYRFIPSVFQYSGGVAAQPGHDIQRVRFRSPVPLAQGSRRSSA